MRFKRGRSCYKKSIGDGGVTQLEWDPKVAVLGMTGEMPVVMMEQDGCCLRLTMVTGGVEGERERWRSNSSGDGEDKNGTRI